MRKIARRVQRRWRVGKIGTGAERRSLAGENHCGNTTFAVITLLKLLLSDLAVDVAEGGGEGMDHMDIEAILLLRTIQRYNNSNVVRAWKLYRPNKDRWWRAGRHGGLNCKKVKVNKRGVYTFGDKVQNRGVTNSFSAQ